MVAIACGQTNIDQNCTVWTPAKIEPRIATLDLSASGQGSITVRQVVCGDLVLCNAVDHIDWSLQSVQFEMCEQCLVDGCSPGGRVSIRRVDEWIVIIPDFAAMCQGEWDANEHAPPRWMTMRGPLSFSHSNWKAFQSACGGAPAFDSVVPASTSELLRLYHFLTPRGFLHDYLSPSQAQWGLILSTNGQDSANDLLHLRKLFSDPSTFDGHDFCKPQTGSYTVSAFLDVLSIEEWHVFSSESDPAIRLSDDIYFRPKSKGGIDHS